MGCTGIGSSERASARRLPADPPSMPGGIGTELRPTRSGQSPGLGYKDKVPMTRIDLHLKSRAILAGVIALLATQGSALAQGCVAVRGAGSCAANPAGMTNLLDSKWLASLSYRWLHSDRHFVGDVEQTARHVTGNQVINDSHFIGLGVSYSITPRYSVSLALPFVRHNRTSWYEHTRTNRHGSQSGGLGDTRLTLSTWILDPVTLPSGNLQVAVGIKAPTGDYAATDTFTTVNEPVIGYVDQSIQPGDGGWGITLELNGYQTIGAGVYAYAQGFYLASPRDVNGTSTRSGNSRGNPYEQISSVPDQYLVRGGLGYALPWVQGVTITFGGRVEGVPVYDLIGDENGFRRPGHGLRQPPAERGRQALRDRHRNLPSRRRCLRQLPDFLQCLPVLLRPAGRSLVPSFPTRRQSQGCQEWVAVHDQGVVRARSDALHAPLRLHRPAGSVPGVHPDPCP